MNKRTARTVVAGITVAALCTACSAGPRVQVKETDLAPKTESTKIFAADGSLITVLQQEENREALKLKEIPKHLRNAVVAIEDSRFYDHRGIDTKAILRALFSNANSGKIVEGGSTITQQLVRTAISGVGKDRTLTRKLKEATYALNVDRDYGKSRILELYLNTVYFGEGAYGVQTAAQVYFNKEARALTLAEGALVAGLIRSPVRYNPRINSDAATRRRNTVLDRMAVNGLAGQKDVDAAKKTKLGIQAKVDRQRYESAYFVDYVTRLIQRSKEFSKLGESEQARGDTLFRRGLRIYTTLDKKAQAAAELAISQVLPDPNSPAASLVALDPKNGHVKALVGGRDFFAAAQDDPCARLGAINADGSPKMCSRVNLALGLGGGGSGRQSGSAFKPFVLATALENDIHLNDVYSAPGCTAIPNADAGGTKAWNVCNYEEQSSGSVTVREGTYRSINTVYAQIINDIGKSADTKSRLTADLGAAKVVETAERMGFCSSTRPLLSSGQECKLSPVPSAALGANAVSTLDMTSAFSSFSDLGKHSNPSPITKITDMKGKVLWQLKEERKQVISPEAAYGSLVALQDVIAKGTGARNGQLGRPAFGKTGTAQEWRDAWFVGGAGTDLVAGVSVFWPDGEIEMKPSCRGAETSYSIQQTPSGPVAIPPSCRATAIRVAGGTWPTQIWRQFMTSALEGVPPTNFPAVNIDKVEKSVDRRQDCVTKPTTLEELLEVLSDPERQSRICDAPGTDEDLSLLPDDSEQDDGNSNGNGEVRTPGVVGLSESQARAVLSRAGHPVSVEYDDDCATEPCRVDRQSPRGGKEVDPGETITIKMEPD